MSIINFIRAMSAALVTLLLIGALIATSRIDAIRMGGPMHSKSVQAADLIADILPPPEYIIEPYLEASLLLADAQSLPERQRKLSDLKRAYDERKQYWESSDLDPELLDLMLRRSDPAAQIFWRELEGSFLPAIGSGDAARAQASYDRLTNAYSDHRSAIDALVEKATTYQAEVKDQASSALTSAVALLVGLAVILVLVVAAFYWGLIRRVIKPIVELSTATKTLADGKEQVVPHCGRTDELGLIARAVGQFRDAAQARAAADARIAAEQQVVTSSLRAGLRALTNCDLTAKISADFPAAYAELKTNFNEALTSLREMIGTVVESAATIRTGSGEIAQASEQLARRTEANAASLEETSAAVTQMNGRLKATAEAAGRTVQRADDAIATVSGGRSVADGAVQAMTRVSESAKGIDSVIEGLDKIAFQTRVLAMNAAVEAARAGEAGRGFAVVADLVSALAMRAEEEAGRARDQLTATQTDIVAAVEMVEKVDSALADISSDVSEVHTLLGQIAADNQAQSTAIAQISVAIGTMDQSTQQNASMVEETSAAARNLSAEVVSLSEQASKFNVGHVARVSARATPTKAKSGGYVAPVKALAVAAMANSSGRHDGWTSFQKGSL